MKLKKKLFCIQNKELKRSNEELRTNMQILMKQNQQLLDHLDTKDKETSTKASTPVNTQLTNSKRKATEFYTDHTYFARIEKQVS